MRVAVLSTYTIDGIKKYHHEWYISKYSEWEKQLLEPQSDLVKFDPEVILLSSDYDGFDLVFHHMDSMSKKFPNSQIFIHSPYKIEPRLFSLLTDEKLESITHLSSFYYRVRNCSNVDVLNVQDAISHLGSNAFDPRYFYLAKMYYTQDALDALADQLQTAINIRFGKRKKCLVLDLDNTLWGGLVADGIENLKLSDDGVGKAFYDFQKHIKQLAESGVILAICSKNDEEQAFEVIEKHPYMLLRKEDFAAWRINWQDKHQNITEIANELNIGRDSLVFIDDSEFEINSVKAVCPYVECVLLPDDPAYYVQKLCSLPFFEAFELTDEDKQRNEMYVQERSRNEERESFEDYRAFLDELGIDVVIYGMDRMNINRISQLTERTNQFNFTGRKFTVKELEEKDSVYCISYCDRFGNQGIIGAAVVHGGVLENFVMSCRVLGRGVEDLFYSMICDKLNPEIEFIETKKNKAAQDFIVRERERPEWITIISSEL